MQNQSHRPTMQDIALELGLSRLTISSVINGKCKERNISDKTINVVEDYLKKRGYIPSSHALALKNKNKSTTGLLITGNLYSHLTEAFNQITHHFISQGQNIEIIFSDVNQICSSLKLILSRGITNLIWLQQYSPKLELNSLEEILILLKGTATTIYNYQSEPEYDEKLIQANIRLVGIDRPKCYKSLAEFIKNNGHINIFTLSQDQAFIHALQNQNLNVYSKAIDTNDFQIASKEIAEHLISLIHDNKVTLASFKDDELAAFVMQNLQSKGIKIPQDISITGFDGLAFSACLSPALTTIKIPTKSMVDWVFEDLTHKNQVTHKQFECSLEKRLSHKTLTLKR